MSYACRAVHAVLCSAWWAVHAKLMKLCLLIQQTVVSIPQMAASTKFMAVLRQPACGACASCLHSIFVWGSLSVDTPMSVKTENIKAELNRKVDMQCQAKWVIGGAVPTWEGTVWYVLKGFTRKCPTWYSCPICSIASLRCNTYFEKLYSTRSCTVIAQTRVLQGVVQPHIAN